jgi:hydroxylaminobenzene mutase
METKNRRRQLIRAGYLLFLIGLLFGLIFPRLANPRMGLSAHLIALQGGVFLSVLGLVWSELSLSPRLETATVWLAFYGNYGNFISNLLAAAFATTRLQPIFGSGHLAADWQENIVSFGLVSISAAVIACCVLVLWGLRRKLAE